MLLRGEDGRLSGFLWMQYMNCKLTDGEECRRMRWHESWNDIWGMKENILIFQIENGFYKNSLN